MRLYVTNNEKKWGITYHELGWLENAIKKTKRLENKTLKHGESMLHVCARNFDGEETAQALIDSGYNVNAKDVFGQTPLFAAVGEGNIDMCLLLLHNDADINHRDKNLNTPLIKSVVNNDLKMVEFLIKHDADINHKNRYGETALKIACQESNVNLAKLLIDNGGDY